MIDKNKAALRFLLSYVKKYWVLICAGLISVALSVGLQTIIPLFVGAAIDFISSDGTAGALRLPPFIQHFIRHGQGTSSVLIRSAVLVLIIAAALALFRTLSRISMGCVKSRRLTTLSRIMTARKGIWLRNALLRSPKTWVEVRPATHRL